MSACAVLPPRVSCTRPAWCHQAAPRATAPASSHQWLARPALAACFRSVSPHACISLSNNDLGSGLGCFSTSYPTLRPARYCMSTAGLGARRELLKGYPHKFFYHLLPVFFPHTTHLIPHTSIHHFVRAFRALLHQVLEPAARLHDPFGCFALPCLLCHGGSHACASHSCLMVPSLQSWCDGRPTRQKRHTCTLKPPAPTASSRAHRQTTSL